MMLEMKLSKTKKGLQWEASQQKGREEKQRIRLEDNADKEDGHTEETVQGQSTFLKTDTLQRQYKGTL